MQSSSALRCEIVDGCLRGYRGEGRQRQFAGRQWLPRSHDCGLAATVPEDLTLITAGSCLRRFLATPLHEIILRRPTATVPAKAKENQSFCDWEFPGPTRVG
jgi:hypothetical protein